MTDENGIATTADIETLAFMAANAWAAENGKRSLYERSGGRPYNTATEGTLPEAMTLLHAALLSKARGKKLVDVEVNLRAEFHTAKPPSALKSLACEKQEGDKKDG